MFSNICKNGLIVFDEGNSKWWPSERKAISEFLKKSKIKYKKELVPFARQPDVILKKIWYIQLNKKYNYEWRTQNDIKR